MSKKPEMTKEDLAYALLCAVAESVARVMDPIPAQLSRFYRWKGDAVGEETQFYFMYQRAAEQLLFSVEREHGELKTVDAMARVSEAAHGALGWCAEGQPFPDA